MTHRSQGRNLYIYNGSVFKGAEGKGDAALICRVKVEVKCFLLNLQYFSGASLQLPPLWAPYSSERKGTCYTNHIHPAFTSHHTGLHPQLLDNFHRNSSHKPAHKHKSNNCFTILAEVKFLTYLRLPLFI